MQTAKDISIKSFLAERGITPKTERNGSGMYLSPIRSERTPSFSVSYSKNRWYDFGIGEGGSIIDLVMKLENCSVAEAYAKLDNGNSIVPRYGYTPHDSNRKPKSTRTIDYILALQKPSLLRYLIDRSIDLSVAQHYCCEVHYIDHGKSYYAIGFANDKGGWELRNKYSKTCSSPKAITTYNDSHRECALFEGFMDFLSYKTLMKHRADTTPRDAVILNSVALMSDAVISHLGSYETVHSYLDNDKAGRATLDKLRPHLRGKLIDHATQWGTHKDLNEWLQHTQITHA